jgi:hypothetical protein
MPYPKPPSPRDGLEGIAVLAAATTIATQAIAAGPGDLTLPANDLARGPRKQQLRDAAIATVQRLVGHGDNPHHAVQLSDHAGQFQTFRVPDIAAEPQLDATFARARTAGVNPAWLRQVGDRLSEDLGVTAAHSQATRVPPPTPWSLMP